MKKWTWIIAFAAFAIFCATVTAGAQPSAYPAPRGIEASAGRLGVEITNPDHDGRALLTLTYPQMSSGEPQIRVRAGGIDLDVDEIGGGSGEGSQYSTVLVKPPFFGEGVLEAEVVANGRRYAESVKINFAPKAAIIPAWVENQLLIGQSGLRFSLRYVSDAVVTVNGKSAEFKYDKIVPRDGITQTALIESNLDRGENTVVITGRSYTGESITVSSRVYLAAGGRIRKGSVVNLVYGEIGSRSGPFYYIKVEGAAIVARRTFETAEGLMVAELFASKKGSATAVISVKPHFRQSTQLLKKVRLTVY